MALDFQDLLSVMRPSVGGYALEEGWALDVWVGLAVEHGFLNCAIQDTAPADTSKLWLDTATDPTTTPSVLKVHNGTEWVAAADNAALVAGRFISSGAGNLTAAGKLAVASGIVGDATALEALKDGVLGDLDATDAAAMVSIIANTGAALEALKDAILGDFDSIDAAAIVTAITSANPAQREALKDALLTTLDGTDAQRVAQALSADSTALETIKDAVMADMDNNDASRIATALVNNATAMEAVKDYVMGDLDAPDARAVVNAIQADTTALNDLKTSIGSLGTDEEVGVVRLKGDLVSETTIGTSVAGTSVGFTTGTWLALDWFSIGGDYWQFFKRTS